jgi:hypothetical protein
MVKSAPTTWCAALLGAATAEAPQNADDAPRARHAERVDPL